MQLKKLGPNMTEIEIRSGTRILYSYETPVAVHVGRDGEPGSKPAGEWLKTAKYHSRTTAQHIAAWLPKGVKARVVPQSEISILAGAK